MPKEIFEKSIINDIKEAEENEKAAREIINKEVDKLTDAEVIEELKKRDKRLSDFVYGEPRVNREFLKELRVKRTDNISFLREKIKKKKEISNF